MDDLFALKQRLVALHHAQKTHATALRRRNEGLKGNPTRMDALSRERLRDDLGLAEAMELLLAEAVDVAGRLAGAEANHG